VHTRAVTGIPDEDIFSKQGQSFRKQWKLHMKYYRRLQTLQSKCLWIIGNSPRRTPIPLLHATFNIPPIRNQIHNITARFFDASTYHKNPLVRAIGNYSLTDLRQNTKNTYINEQNTFYSKPRPPTTRSSVFSLFNIFTAPYRRFSLQYVSPPHDSSTNHSNQLV
jgi:hypothetical protein